MACKRCGRCCIDAFMTLWTIDEENRAGVIEKAKWLNYHRCDTMITKSKGVERLAIKIPLTCMHLSFEEGKYGCKIYEKRPKTCSLYTCDNFTDEERKEILEKGGI